MATTTDLEKQFYELYIATSPASITDLKNAFLAAIIANGEIRMSGQYVV